MKDDSAINIFGLIRHAQTVWNQEKRMQGQSDSPLTGEGEDQARKWGPQLQLFNLDLIVSSNAGRALRTAALINATLQVPLIVDIRLREQNWGEWTGKTLKQIKKQFPGLLFEQETAGWGFCPPGGENRDSVWTRSLEALKETAKKWPGTKILVITHEGIIKSLIYRLAKREFLPKEDHLLCNNHLHWLICNRKELGIKKINALALSGSG